MNKTKEAYNLKPLPHMPTKKQLRSMYWQSSNSELIRMVNHIIKKTRKYPKGKTPQVHRLFQAEFEELIEYIGYPVGYEKEFRP